MIQRGVVPGTPPTEEAEIWGGGGELGCGLGVDRTG